MLCTLRNLACHCNAFNGQSQLRSLNIRPQCCSSTRTPEFISQKFEQVLKFQSNVYSKKIGILQPQGQLVALRICISVLCYLNISF